MGASVAVSDRLPQPPSSLSSWGGDWKVAVGVVVRCFVMHWILLSVIQIRGISSGSGDEPMMLPQGPSQLIMNFM